MPAETREPLVELAVDAGVARLTLNRPARHNSLVPALLDALLEHLRRIAADRSVRAVVLGARGRSFSTGGDVRGFHQQPDAALADYADTLVGRLNAAILALMDLPQPVIGRVQGPVTGGALGLVLACDLVAVTPEAFFAPYYVVVGFAPDGGWTAILPDRIGVQRAREIQLLNRRVEADEAVALGLATERVAADRLDPTIDDWLARLGGFEAGAIDAARRGLLTAERRAAYASGLDAERAQFRRRVVRAETRRGMARFLGEAAPAASA